MLMPPFKSLTLGALAAASLLLLASPAAQADALEDIMKAKVLKVAVPQDCYPLSLAAKSLERRMGAGRGH
jgi:hypothetical protein